MVVIFLNEQDQKILELYLKDRRKKKIILIVVITFLLMLCTVISEIYVKKYKQMDIPNNETNLQEQNFENTLNETVITNDENSISQNISESTKDNTENNEIANVTQEPKQENKNENKKENTENKPQSNTTSKVSETKKEETPKQKPSNKDFLFTDGYNMENVSQAAQDYLKSSGFAGECIPLKDDEGIYIGMRVIFH